MFTWKYGKKFFLANSITSRFWCKLYHKITVSFVVAHMRINISRCVIVVSSLMQSDSRFWRLGVPGKKSEKVFPNGFTVFVNKSFTHELRPMGESAYHIIWCIWILACSYTFHQLENTERNCVSVKLKTNFALNWLLCPAANSLNSPNKTSFSWARVRSDKVIKATFPSCANDRMFYWVHRRDSFLDVFRKKVSTILPCTGAVFASFFGCYTELF